MAFGGAGSGSDRDHWKFGLGAVVAGVVGLLAVVLSVVLLNKGNETAIIGAAGSPIVAMVSAYFGIAVSAQAQKSIKDQGDKAAAASLLVDPHHPETKGQVADLVKQFMSPSPQTQVEGN